MKPIRGALALTILSLGVPGLAAESTEVSMELYSWDKLLHGWSIRSDGSTEIRARSEASSDKDPPIQIRHAGPSPGRYAQVETLLRSVKPLVKRGFNCDARITDMPYGHIRWYQSGAFEKLDFDFGCSSPEARQILHQINEADSVIGAAWKEAEPLAREVKP